MFVAHEDATRGERRRGMVITLVTDTFNVNNNGTTMSAMRLAAALVARGHTVRVVACGAPGHAPDGPELFQVPELVVPVARE